MSTNDRALLDGILSSRKTAVAPDIADDKFFELFLAEQLLWDRDLSWEELLEGIIGGGGDGGIDALYIFCNGALLATDSPPFESRSTVQYELFVIQAKRATGFTEITVDKLQSSLVDLFNFDNDLQGLKNRYNSELIEIIALFRNSYISNAGKFPAVSFKIFYGTRGFEVHPNVLRKSNNLNEALERLFSAGEFTFSFVTPSNLIEMARRQRPTTLDLRVAEVISTSAEGWIALVALDAYFDFVSTESGELRRAIFESNVRDYEGNAKVNASIRGTLEDGEGDDFWWLNNGVTVIATRAGNSGKKLTLEHPQVVNGLQTTKEIHSYVAKRRAELAETELDGRMVLVRIVVPPTDVSRDGIIRATNSQTPIPGVALRATDKIQRDIEDYFLQNGYYYERRKNYYKNEGKPISRIITIPYLAEAVLAVLLNEPHLGKPRFGGGFLRDDRAYSRIFDTARPLSSLLYSVKLTQRVEESIRFRPIEEQGGPIATETAPLNRRRRKRERISYMFPTAMVVALITQQKEGPAEDVDAIPFDLIGSCEDFCMRVDLSGRNWKGSGGTDILYAKALIEHLPSISLGTEDEIVAETALGTALDEAAENGIS